MRNSGLLIFKLLVIYNQFWHFSCLNLTILHTNDVHARFIGYNDQSRACSEDDIKANKCYGGAARRATAVKQIRAENKNVLLLDGGDQYQGTLWYTALKWQPIAAYMNAMNYTAMAFGNHEFDDGSEDGLRPFIKNITFPIVNSNIEIDASQMQQGPSFDTLYKKSYTLNVSGQMVAIIGYTSQETSDLSRPGPYLKFRDEIESLKKVVDQLQSSGINKIIAIGHSGIVVDRKICQEVPGVDVVVGGHTNTFLYTGTPPSKESAEGPYPEVYTATGANCLVVQDYAFGKYLGFLQITIDDDTGIVKSWKGNPILLNTTFAEDQDMLSLLQPFQKSLKTIENTFIGVTAVALDGRTESCRLKECNLGNLIADALLYYYLNHEWSSRPNRNQWSSVGIALMNGGGIREYQAKPMDNLTLGDLYTFMPFGNTIELIQIEGKYLMEAFEHSVEDYSDVEKHGKFLQVAGVRVVYDLNKPNGQRVKSIFIVCTKCEIPIFEPLQLNHVYNVVTVSYLKNGGDGYSMIKNNVLRSDSNEILDVDAVLTYVKKFQPLYIGVEDRIIFSNNSRFGTFADISPNPIFLDSSCNPKYKSVSAAVVVISCIFLKLLS